MPEESSGVRQINNVICSTERAAPLSPELGDGERESGAGRDRKLDRGRGR